MTIALSWSRWSDFAQCHLKFYLKYLEKSPNFQMKDDDKNKSPHLVRGQNLHKQLENYTIWKLDMVAGRTTMVPPPMLPETAALIPAIDRIIETSEVVIPESQVAVDNQWQQVAWFDKQAYYRAILDLTALRKDHGIIWDYKSGKFQDYVSDETDPGQLHLSAAMILKMKDFDYVDVSYLFIDSKKPSGIRVTRDQGPKIIQIFDERHARVNAEREWKPKRNDNCNFCEATAKQCPYSKKL